MVFLLSKIAWGLSRPSGALVLLAAVGLLLGGVSRHGLARLALVAGVAGLTVVVLLPLDQWLLRPLEDRFPRPAPPARVDGIVVLGGAIDGLISADRGIPSLNGEAERLTEFLALARRYPDARLCFTGGIGDLLPGAVAEAGTAGALFAALGLSPERVVFEAASRTTWENAVLSRALLHPAAGETWLLITSASHMPRAVGAFRAAGWHVLPWPVAYKTTRETRLATLAEPLGIRLGRLDWAAHEWVGLLAYWALGHGSALFPAP